MYTRNATIWVIATLHIAFECIPILQCMIKFENETLHIISLKLILAVKDKWKHVLKSK